MNLKLSIIVPFFNTGNYIIECLDSIFLQDISENEYEVICVNDCSTDNTKELVIKYQKSHNNLILIEHKKNQMLGAARNTGLSIAKGEHIWFVDSDDFIKTNILSYLLKVIQDNDLEILQFNCEKFTNNGQFFKYKFYKDTKNVIRGIAFLKVFFDEFKCIPSETCFKIFKRSFLINNEFYFPEGVYFEDAVHTLKSYYFVERFLYVSDIIYYYRINENSITSSDLYSPTKLADWFNFSIGCLDILKENRDETSLNTKLKDFYIKYIKEVQLKVMFLSKIERDVFYEKLDVLKIRKRYYKFHFICLTITFKGLIKESLIIIKKKFPFIWKMVKDLKPKFR